MPINLLFFVKFIPWSKLDIYKPKVEAAIFYRTPGKMTAIFMEFDIFKFLNTLNLKPEGCISTSIFITTYRKLL